MKALRHAKVVPSARRPAHGFTLIEMVVSAMLLGFLAVTATFFWVHNLSIVQTVNTDTSALADARAVLERLAREIRETKYDTATGRYCAPTMAGGEFAFNKTSGSYATGCGGISNPDATKGDFAVNVKLTGTTLRLAYSGALASPAIASDLATGVGAFSIRYRDVNFNPLDPNTLTAVQMQAGVRYLELTLTMSPNGVQSTTARTVVALRNV